MRTWAWARGLGSGRALGVALLLLALLVGCARGQDAPIQGAWIYSAPGVGGVTTQTSVHTNWRFDDGSVHATSCCEDRPGFSGKYRVIAQEEDVLLLALYDLVEDATLDNPGGRPLAPYEVRIEIDREHDALRIQGVGPFLRDDALSIFPLSPSHLFALSLILPFSILSFFHSFILPFFHSFILPFSSPFRRF